MRHFLRIAGGFLLVALGLIGLVMPIMPGWALLIPGLILLADYFRPIRRLVDWAKAKLEGTYPDLFNKEKRASER